jgi:hypothetical protein
MNLSKMSEIIKGKPITKTVIKGDREIEETYAKDKNGKLILVKSIDKKK